MATSRSIVHEPAMPLMCPDLASEVVKTDLADVNEVHCDGARLHRHGSELETTCATAKYWCAWPARLY